MVMIETPMNIKGVTETFMLQQHQHRKEQAANSTSDLSLMNLPRTSSVRVAVSVTRSPPKRQTLQPLKPVPTRPSSTRTLALGPSEKPGGKLRSGAVPARNLRVLCN